jgi:heme-degrading monooxygenase HmoA
MPGQFSQDDSIANAGVIVHVWVASIAPGDCTTAAQRLTELMEDTVADLPGFLQGEVLEADDRRSVIALSHWTSRHIWAQAQWNQEVGRVVAGLFQSGAKMVDTMYYVRTAIRSTKEPPA